MKTARVYPYPEREEPITTSTDEKKSASRSTSTTWRSSTTTVQVLTESDRVRAQHNLERVKTLHLQYFGRGVPAPIAAEILRDLYSGTPVQYYLYAIKQTFFAPRPSWRYTMAIMDRLRREQPSGEELSDG